ncbi:hypothetical protein EVAR_49176_1 [Eumeta japonica]|uniref:Uncharacterized protein n=1 Tax=Eumeta variegata TaxID=151549 RepID=A0A4C1YJT6_EUMVA|nr:hypothetical protein EVAR_49176_1 [Eumeta japonica]
MNKKTKKDSAESGSGLGGGEGGGKKRTRRRRHVMMCEWHQLVLSFITPIAELRTTITFLFQILGSDLRPSTLANVEGLRSFATDGLTCSHGATGLI